MDYLVHDKSSIKNNKMPTHYWEIDIKMSFSKRNIITKHTYDLWSSQKEGALLG